MKKQTDHSLDAELSSVADAIAGLADGDRPLSNSDLAELTDLTPEELRLFELVWQGMTPERQRKVVSRLVELAEDNVELNFDAIFRHRLKDDDAGVRRQAIEGLWENQEASLIQPFTELMMQDDAVKVREEAATALGRFAMLAEHGKLSAEQKDRLGQALLATIDDVDNPVDVRRRALEAAAPLSLPRVGQAIREAYYSDDHRLKTSAIYAMGRNCDPNWLEVLTGELSSADAELRYEAAAACGELGEEEAVPRLVELTEDEDAEVRLVAVQALGKIGGNEAKECLELCLNHPSEAVRQVAEQALYELETMSEPGSIPWLKFRGEP
jgi:HEAT repeat protein